jgi:hypothetical protein
VRRGSSTVVSIVGEVGEALLAEVDRSTNVSVVRSRGPELEPAIAALGEAAGRASPYVVVAADPLAGAAAAWRAMWTPGAAGQGTAGFEEAAGEALLAWRAHRFELPDYYLVVAGEPGPEAVPHPEDFHLGVLRAERPSRVLAVPSAEARVVAARVARTLRGLPAGPWWPPLDRLMDAARSAFPGRVAS